MSLAPWYYRGVVDREAGPVAKLTVSKLSAGLVEEWQALAYLVPGLVPEEGAPAIYGIADGSGTATSKSVACNKAISEALERWAWGTMLADKARSEALGFDVDSSTNGFAAWPGPWSRRAREAAYLESAERWSLAAWWAGLVGHKPLVAGIVPSMCDGVELITPISGASVVVLHRGAVGGLHAYGFAAGTDLARAVAKARIELERNVVVLAGYAAKAAAGTALEPRLVYERRLLHYAGEDGYGRFAARLAKTAEQGSLAPPELLVDERVQGPWDRYCRVWRCLHQPVVARDLAGLSAFLF